MKTSTGLLNCFFCVALCACASNDSISISGTIADKQSINQPAFSANGSQYIGSRSSTGAVDAFLGVPFAQPPAGDLRWAPPRPLIAENGTQHNAKSFGPACMQGPHMVKWYQGVVDSFGGDPATFPAPEVSEDCLYLNIWRPHDVDPQEPLPVFVYIHGGSNKGGWSYEPNYIGEQMAARGVIVVSIAYRLGVFGFFAHPDLKPANFALLDQIAALQWIKNNIQAVGGDPDNITVAGESSGANNIAYLMVSPLAKGLFHRVVHQSGGWAVRGAASKASYDELGLKLSNTLLGDSEKAGIEELRKLPAEQVLSSAQHVYQGHFFDPVVDGHSIVQSVDAAAAHGQIANVDLLIGSNANEALMYLDTDQTLDQWIAENLPAADAQQVKQQLNPEHTALQQQDQLATAFNYACPSLQLAAAVSDTGSKVWVYYFSKQRSGELGAQMGAYHGIELPYVFNTHDDWLPTDALDRSLTESVMRYWVQFMHGGNPNTKSDPDWPTYAKMGDPILNLGVPIRSETHASQQLCRLMNP